MELKKKPKADLNKRSVWIFQIALVVLLFLAWMGIEYKSDYAAVATISSSDTFLRLQEEPIPVTVIVKDKPIPPKEPVIDEVIPGKEDFVKLKFENHPELVVADVAPEKVTFIDKPDVIQDVLIKFVDQVPVFPGCEDEESNDARRECMNQKINDFISDRFNRDLGSDLGLKGINTIYVSFKIDETGKVVGVKSRNPHPSLQKEAERVINSLPEMIPGKQRGTPVGVLYSLPIVFDVQ